MAEMDRDVLLLLGRIDGKLDDLKEAFTAHVIDDAKVEQRVRTIERRHSWFLGGLAVVAVFVPLAARYLIQ